MGNEETQTTDLGMRLRDGVWYTDFLIDDERVRRSTGFREENEQLAQERTAAIYTAEKEKRERRAIVSGTPTVSEGPVHRTAVDTLFEDYLAYIPRTKSKSYVPKAASHWRNYLRRRFRTLDDLFVPNAVQAYINDRLGGKLNLPQEEGKRAQPERASENTAYKEMVTLRQFCRHLKRIGKIAHMPDFPEFSDFHPVQRYIPVLYTEEMVERILAALPDRHTPRRGPYNGEPVRERYTFQYEQDMRPGLEMDTLRWCDIDFVNACFSVQPDYDKQRPDTTESIALTERALNILRELYAERSQQGPVRHTDLVWGKHEYHTSLKVAARKLGFPIPRRHDFRHWRTTHLAKTPGVTGPMLQAFARHKSFQTTQKYIHGKLGMTASLVAATEADAKKKKRLKKAA